MINLEDVSIVTHIRLDSADRLENILLRNKVLMSLATNIEFIVIEDDSIPKVKDFLNPEDTYRFFKNDGPYMKNHAYNLGASISTRDYMVFLDADCIIHPKIMRRLIDNNSSAFEGLVYPYNRFALYMFPKAKQLFKHDPNYNTLEKLVQNVKLSPRLIIEGGRVHGNCNGGSFMITKAFFEKVNGFNPNFKGWGYEDNEFITRMRRLEHIVTSVDGDENLMFHLHHITVINGITDAPTKIRSRIHTADNKQILEGVRNMSKIQAEHYCTTWTL